MSCWSEPILAVYLLELPMYMCELCHFQQPFSANDVCVAKGPMIILIHHCREVCCIHLWVISGQSKVSKVLSTSNRLWSNKFKEINEKVITPVALLHWVFFPVWLLVQNTGVAISYCWIQKKNIKAWLFKCDYFWLDVHQCDNECFIAAKILQPN